MDRPAPLTGLDRIDWSLLSHAYGTAEDVPSLLRGVASDEEERAVEAEEELWSSIVHQGTVYSATAPAVPFLARLAVEGVRRTALLGMLGAIAESVDEHDLPLPGAARAAVAEQLGMLLPLLADRDPEVRQTTAWTVAQCGSAAGPVAGEALRARWAAEGEPVVRADVLTARLLVVPEAAEELCAAGLAADQPAPVQVAALLAGVDHGLPWTTDTAARVAELVPLERHGFGRSWQREPLQAISAGLHGRGEAVAAIDVLARALERATVLRSQDAERALAAIAEVRWAAESLALRSRTAPARLLPGFLPLLGDQATAAEVMPLLRSWCQPAPTAIPTLVAVAEGDGDPADEALAVLVHLGAPEAARLLARQLPQRPRALEAAYRLATGEDRTPTATPASEDRTRLPFDPALLDVLRARLAALEPPAGGRSVFAPGGLAAINEPVHLSGVLAAWGRAARPALPELLTALPHHPLPVGRALAAIADPGADTQVTAALRTLTAHGPLEARQAAANALHALTGEPDALLPILAEQLSRRGNGLDRAVTAAAALGDAAHPLLPHLYAVLAEPASSRETPPAIDAALQAAALVRELTGDRRPALQVIAEGIGWSAHPWGRMTAERAAEAARHLGPAAKPLVPLLLPLLDDPDLVPAVVHTLTAFHPGSDAPAGLARADLADRVLAATRPGSYAGFAAKALEALSALGPTAFDAARLDRLDELANGDQRIVGSGLQNRIVLADERFRTAARAVREALTTSRLSCKSWR
ncbi:hypothetical protein ACIA8O_25275 [Kitasatospora sp. NPDC051853]|uniref:hypothetical protein n=1 Tax=Kitasatospora sp. NPDC051853 TaxID=3364058 RepID=UPI0037B2C630